MTDAPVEDTGLPISRAAISVAVLESLFRETGKSSLDLLVPFVGHLTLTAGFAELGPTQLAELCTLFKREYGLRIPYHVMSNLVRKASHSGLVALSADRTHFAPVADRVKDLGFEARTESMAIRWEALIAELRSFCKSQGFDLSVMQAEAGFLGFLKSHDADILIASSGQSILPYFPFSEDAVFMANSFVCSLAESKGGSLEFVVECATGHVLASTILNWNLKDYVGHLGGLYVYLDTPLILQLLGLDDEARFAAAEELVALLQSRGAVVCVMEHVIEESVDLINGAKMSMTRTSFDPDKAGPMAVFMFEHSWGVLEVEKCIVGLDDRLRDLGIQRVAAPGALLLVEHQIDEKTLTARIVEEYTRRVRNFNYADRKWTIERDVRSISAIHKLRKGRRSAQLGTAQHVFVTPNVGLAIASRHFEEADGGFAQRTIPACITDGLIATVAWLESPDAGQHMNTRRVLAEAFAAVQPSQALLTRLYADLRVRRDIGQIDEAEYRALAADPIAREMLAQVTKNDASQYQAQTTMEIIEEYRQRYELAASEELGEERQRRLAAVEAVEGSHRHHERLAQVAGGAAGALVLVLGICVVVWSALASQLVWSVVGVVMGVLGGSVLALSRVAKGWVYRLALLTLEPAKDAPAE